jgi:ABC-type dipeptide/oligopeptide/nickel transport system permease component
MLHYIGGRILQAVVVLLLMTIVIFVVARMAGDPLESMLSIQATEQDRMDLAVRLGLDKSLPEQYWIWLRLVTHGDFGNSILMPYSVMHLVKAFGLNTLKLVLYGAFFALLLGLPLGILAGVWRGQALDIAARTIAALGQSAPTFWVALMLMFLFAIKWKIFPVLGFEDIRGAVLPSVSLGLYMTAAITRLLRSAIIEAMESDYITLARIKGLSEAVVVLKHALRNALIPVVTYTGMTIAMMMSGVVLVEVVFACPGIGFLLFKSSLGGDYPVLQGVVLLITASVIVANLIVDVAYAYIDPRIRYRKI